MNTASPLSNRPKYAKRSNRIGTVPQKLKAEDPPIDEGYLSGNPPPPTTTQDHSKLKTIPLGSSASNNASSRLESTTGPKSLTESDIAKTKPTKSLELDEPKISGVATTTNATSTAAMTTTTNVIDLAQSGVRPRLLQRSESRTFVFVYDEDAKTSKPVTAPDNLNVDVPVLLQYGLTDDAIEQCLEKPAVGTSLTDDDDDVDEAGKRGVVNGIAPKDSKPTKGSGVTEGGNDKFCSPTERLLRSREKDELKNRGMHVVKWLVSLEDNDVKDGV